MVPTFPCTQESKKQVFIRKKRILKNWFWGFARLSVVPALALLGAGGSKLGSHSPTADYPQRTATASVLYSL